MDQIVRSKCVQIVGYRSISFLSFAMVTHRTLVQEQHTKVSVSRFLNERTRFSKNASTQYFSYTYNYM